MADADKDKNKGMNDDPKDKDTDDPKNDPKDKDTDDPKNDPKDKDVDKVDRAELQKVIAQRQALKRKLREQESKLSELEGLASDYEDLKKKATEFETLKEEFDRIKAAEEEKELANKSKAEREAIRIRKELEAMKTRFEEEINSKIKELESRETEISNLRSEISNLQSIKLENEIRDAAVKADAYNPNQIVKMLKGNFEYDEDTGDFIFPIYKTVKGERVLADWKDVGAYVSEFLSDEDNSNLVRSKVRSGTGARVSNSGGGRTSTGDRIDSSKSKYSTSELKDMLTKWAETRDVPFEYAVEAHRKFGDDMFAR